MKPTVGKTTETVKNSNRRAALETQELSSENVITKEPYLVDVKNPKADISAGIFLFIQDSSAKHIHYDADFKKHARIMYVERSFSGNVISKGDFETCGAEKLKDFIKLPELSVVDLDDIFCPPFEIADKIGTGEIELEIEKCGGTGCVPNYKLFKFFSTKLITTGVYYKKPYRTGDTIDFTPEIKVSNRLTIVENEYAS